MKSELCWIPHSPAFPSDPRLSLAGVFQDSSFHSTSFPHFRYQCTTFPGYLHGILWKLFFLWVSLFYFPHRNQWPPVSGVLVFCDKLPSAGFLEANLLKSLIVSEDAAEASRLPSHRLGCIRYMACFPCNGRDRMGFIGCFVKLAATPWEKTVSFVLIWKSA